MSRTARLIPRAAGEGTEGGAEEEGREVDWGDWEEVGAREGGMAAAGKAEAAGSEAGEVAEMASLEPKRRETMTYKRIG